MRFRKRSNALMNKSALACVKVRLAVYQARGKLIANIRRVYIMVQNGPTIRDDVISGAREQYGLPATELFALLNRTGSTFPLSSDSQAATVDAHWWGGSRVLYLVRQMDYAKAKQQNHSITITVINNDSSDSDTSEADVRFQGPTRGATPFRPRTALGSSALQPPAMDYCAASFRTHSESPLRKFSSFQ